MVAISHTGNENITIYHHPLIWVCSPSFSSGTWERSESQQKHMGQNKLSWSRKRAEIWVVQGHTRCQSLHAEALELWNQHLDWQSSMRKWSKTSYSRNAHRSYWKYMYINHVRLRELITLNIPQFCLFICQLDNIFSWFTNNLQSDSAALASSHLKNRASGVKKWGLELKPCPGKGLLPRLGKNPVEEDLFSLGIQSHSVPGCFLWFLKWDSMGDFPEHRKGVWSLIWDPHCCLSWPS